MTRPTLAIAAVVSCVFALVMMCARPAQAADKLIPNAQDGGCFVPGDDAGHTAKATVVGGTQFMVSASATVNYRACATSSCTALPSDAPIAAGQVDLCMPSGYTTVSFYANDAGAQTVCVYAVSPKTVCQVNSP